MLMVPFSKSAPVWPHWHNPSKVSITTPSPFVIYGSPVITDFPLSCHFIDSQDCGRQLRVLFFFHFIFSQLGTISSTCALWQVSCSATAPFLRERTLSLPGSLCALKAAARRNNRDSCRHRYVSA